MATKKTPSKHAQKNARPAPKAKAKKPPAARATRATSAADASAKPAGADLPDLRRALPRPLKPEQVQGLLKINDADLALSARVARTYAKHAATLRIKGIDADEMQAHIAEAEALAPEETRAQRLVDRIKGARQLAEDAVWRDVLKIAKHLKPLEGDDEELAADFAFLHEHLSARHGRHTAPKTEDKPEE